MAKEICVDCGKVYNAGAHTFFCPDCRKKRLSEAAKRRKLNEIGNRAYSERQAKRKAEG